MVDFNSLFEEKLKNIVSDDIDVKSIELSHVNVDDCYFVDSGYNYVFNSAMLKVVFFKVCSLNINSKDSKDVFSKRYFLFISENYELYCVDGYDDYNFSLFKVDLPSFNVNLVSGINDELKKDMSISIVVDMVRRYLELDRLKSLIPKGVCVLDGSLQPYYDFEKSLISEMFGISDNIFGLSKKTNFNKFIRDFGYVELVQGKLRSIISKLDKDSNHQFRIDFASSLDVNYVISLFSGFCDNVFIGYPYGLIMVDKLARVSDHDRNLIRMIISQSCSSREDFDSLMNQSNAHDIIDLINFR